MKKYYTANKQEIEANKKLAMYFDDLFTPKNEKEF